MQYKIAIVGKANSGKNTLSNIFKSQLKESNYLAKIAIVAFADPIKEMARIMFPNIARKYFFGASKFRNEIITGCVKNNRPLTVRQVLIDIGTELGRGYKDSIWLDNFDARLNKISAKNDMVIVSDVRFKNECEFLRKRGFKIVKLTRDNQRPSINNLHVSETEQDFISDSDIDFIIDNDSSLQDLKNKATQVFKQLK